MDLTSLELTLAPARAAKYLPSDKCRTNCSSFAELSAILYLMMQASRQCTAQSTRCASVLLHAAGDYLQLTRHRDRSRRHVSAAAWSGRHVKTQAVASTRIAVPCFALLEEIGGPSESSLKPPTLDVQRNSGPRQRRGAAESECSYEPLLKVRSRKLLAARGGRHWAGPERRSGQPKASRLRREGLNTDAVRCTNTASPCDVMKPT